MVLTSPTREFLARRVVDALERVERGEPEEEDEPHHDDHVLEPVRPDELAAKERVVPVRRVVAAQRRLFSWRKIRGTFHLNRAPHAIDATSSTQVCLMFPFFTVLKGAGLFRVSDEVEDEGLDMSKHGGAAYEIDVRARRPTFNVPQRECN